MRNSKLVLPTILVLLAVILYFGVNTHEVSNSAKLTKSELVKQIKKTKHLQAEIESQKKKERELTQANNDLNQRLEQSQSQLNQANQQVSSLQQENERLKK